MSTIEVRSPYDQSLLSEIPLVGKEEVLQALDKAYGLFENQLGWIPPHERIAILERTAAIMNERIEELTNRAAAEGGKPYVDSKAEVMRAINGVKLAAEHIGQLKGEQIPMGLTKASENRLAFTMREPIGVVASISAFNHPLNRDCCCRWMSGHHQASTHNSYVVHGFRGNIERSWTARRLVPRSCMRQRGGRIACNGCPCQLLFVYWFCKNWMDAALKTFSRNQSGS